MASSYQKLKKEIDRLNEDLSTLVFAPNSLQAELIIKRIRALDPDAKGFDGLIKILTRAEDEIRTTLTGVKMFDIFGNGY